MKWNAGDDQYEFDGELTVADCINFKEKANLGYREIDPALQRGDIHAMMCMTYILKRRAGEAVPWSDMMDLHPGTLGWVAPDVEPVEPDVAVGEPEEKAEKAGPTRSATGKTQRAGTTKT